MDFIYRQSVRGNLCPKSLAFLKTLAYTDHQNIINITNGAFLALDLYRLQSLVLQNKPNAQFSDFTPLTPPQLTTLQAMVTSIVNMNYLHDGTPYDADGENWSIEPNGGGLYFFNSTPDAGALVNDNAVVSKIAFIGAGSVLGKQGSANDDAIMINSSCYTAACSVGSGASVIESTLSASNENAEKFKVQLDPTSQVISSQISVSSPDSSAFIHLSSSASIASSVVQGVQGLTVEAAATLKDSLLTFHSQDNSLTRLDLKAGSTTDQLKAIIATHSSPTSGIFSVSVPAGQQLELQMASPLQCQPTFTPILSVDLSITGITSLNNLCQLFQRPPGN